MAFFDAIAQWIIDFCAGSWTWMKLVAGKLINSTFGWYTGTPIDDSICAIMVFGGLGFIIVLIIVLKKAFAVRH